MGNRVRCVLSSFLVVLTFAASVHADDKATIADLQDRALLSFFPEAAGAKSSALDLNQVMQGSDLDPAHIATFENAFDAYLDAEIARGNLPSGSKEWWEANRGLFLKKAFMQTPGATISVLGDGIGRTIRESPHGDKREDAKNVWSYVKKYGKWALVGLGYPAWEIVKGAYVSGPVASLANASLQNWIRSPQEDLSTASSRLRNWVGAWLKDLKKGRKAAKQLEEAKAMIKQVQLYENKLQNFMASYDFVHLSPEQADANYKIMMAQARDSFNALSASVAPYLREGRANIFDMQARALGFANGIATFNGQKMAAEDRLERDIAQLEQKGIKKEAIDRVLDLRNQLFELYGEQPDMETAELEKELETAKESLIRLGATQVQVERIVSDHALVLNSIRQMGTTMASWWDHDIRYPELNRNLDPKLAQIATVTKTGLGFGEYLRIPGVQDEMRRILRYYGWQLDQAAAMIDEKRKELGIVDPCEEAFKKVAQP